MKKNALIAITISFLVVLGIIIYLILSPSEEKKEDAISIRNKLPFEFFEDKPQFLTPQQIEEIIKEKGISDEVLKEIYKEYSQYPDFSRPLDKKMLDLINPWYVDAQPLPIVLNLNLKNEKAL